MYAHFAKRITRVSNILFPWIMMTLISCFRFRVIIFEKKRVYAFLGCSSNTLMILHLLYLHIHFIVHDEVVTPRKRNNLLVTSHETHNRLSATWYALLFSLKFQLSRNWQSFNQDSFNTETNTAQNKHTDYHLTTKMKKAYSRGTSRKTSCQSFMRSVNTQQFCCKIPLSILASFACCTCTPSSSQTDKG